MGVYDRVCLYLCMRGCMRVCARVVFCWVWVAVDMSKPDAVVSPGAFVFSSLCCVVVLLTRVPVAGCGACVRQGGVGFDINCGVRLLRTNLDYKDLGGYSELWLRMAYVFSELDDDEVTVWCVRRANPRAGGPVSLRSHSSGGWIYWCHPDIQ